MPAKARLPKPLPPEIARPLVAISDRLLRLQPWRFMADLHLIGSRDESTGELRVASVMGALGEMFAVSFYRGPAGLSWIHDMATTDEQPAGASSLLEGMNFVKVEWTPKRELGKPDLGTLAGVGYKPPGRGSVWPRFQSGKPGWIPWLVSESEAIQLTADLSKVLRFAELFATRPDLWNDRMRGEIAVVPAGDGPLQPEQIEWLPLVPPAVPTPEPFPLPEEEWMKLAALPQRPESIFEFTAQLVPEISFMDEQALRPCIARAALVSDQRSYFVLASELMAGHEPMQGLVGRTFVKGLSAAKARPGLLLVDTPALARVLGPACAALDIPLQESVRLKAAHDALQDLAEHFAQRARR